MHASEPVIANFTGFTHIAFEVDDVDQTLNAAMKSGGKLLGNVTEFHANH